MSNTTTETKKKNVVYKVFAAILALACVGICFLPINVFNGFWANGAIPTAKQSIIKTVQALLSSDSKLFGFLPVLVYSETSILAFAINAALYAFLLAIVVSFLLAIVAIFWTKLSPAFTRTVFFIVTAATIGYALSIYLISGYITVAVSAWKPILEINMAIVFGVCAIIYFAFSIAKAGKGTIVSFIQFLLTCAITGLILLAVAKNARTVSEAMNAKALYTWIILGGVVAFCLNNFIAFCRMQSKVGLSGDLVRYILQALLSLATCYFIYAAKLTKGSLLIYAILAAAASVISITIVAIQLVNRTKANGKVETTNALDEFETETTVEAVAYEGGPVAGIEMAEEVNPSATSAAAEGEATPVAAKSKETAATGNVFDPFLSLLSAAEKEEFVDLYILKCKGAMPEIPTYEVGGDNKAFFNKVFIYLGQYREKVSSALLAKMYKYVMKL